MKNYLNLIFAASAGLSLAVHAETSLVFELVDAQGTKKEQTYTLHGRWARVDDTAEEHKKFLILDTGFMIMHVVDSEKEVFSTFGDSPFHQGKKLQTKSGDEANPKQATKNAVKVPTLKPTGSRDSVADVRCNIVNEIVDNKPVAEHCMANAAAMGMSRREITTMARLIQFSRDWTDPDWMVVQMNEQFISIRSRPAGGDVIILLKAVSHQTPPVDFFRVPKEYRKLDPGTDYEGLITGKK